MPTPPTPTDMVNTSTDTDGSTMLVWRRPLPLPVDTVWAMITEREGLQRWIGTWTGTPKVGGTVSFTMTGEADADGDVPEALDVRITTCDAPHHLVVEFPEPESDEVFHLDLTVEADGTDAVLVFAQTMPPLPGPMDLDAGWRWYLDRLAATVAGTPMPDWSDYAPGGPF